MKIWVLTLLMALVGANPTPAAEENHSVEKRSPDDDLYYFLPQRNYGAFNTHGRTSSFGRFFNLRRPGRYFVDLDDLFDDRRKRETQPADAPTHRQKRAADFDDDDDFYWYRRPLTTAVTYNMPRTSVSPFVRRQVFAPVQRYFYSFDDDDDDHFDRKKRSAEPDEDDYFRYVYNAPVTTYRLPIQTLVSTHPRTTQAVTYSPVRYYYDFDFDDKK